MDLYADSIIRQTHVSEFEMKSGSVKLRRPGEDEMSPQVQFQLSSDATSQRTDFIPLFNKIQLCFHSDLSKQSLNFV